MTHVFSGMMSLETAPNCQNPIAIATRAADQSSALVGLEKAPHEDASGVAGMHSRAASCTVAPRFLLLLLLAGTVNWREVLNMHDPPRSINELELPA